VIGTSSYNYVATLRNPANDISKASDTAGFEAETLFDLGQQEMLRTLQAYERRSIGADMAVLYYAGHGSRWDRIDFAVSNDLS